MNYKEAKDFFKKSLENNFNTYDLDALSKLVFLDIFKLNEKEFSKNISEIFIEIKKLEEVIQRLKNHEPLQYIAGFTYFNGLKIMVDKNVLIPRPETEELIYWIKEDNISPNSIFADICTGSGCIALALQKHYSGSKIIATDISEKALNVAINNEKSLFKTQNIRFIQHNCLTEKWQEMMPDIVVSNPPYIAINEKEKMEKNVLNYEPHLALFTPQNEELLFYKSILNLFSKNKKTIYYFEINPLFTNELKSYCEGLNLQCVFRYDMFGKVRFAKVF